MPSDKRKQSRTPQTVGMVRLTIKHRAESTAHVIVIEHDELNAWIGQMRTYGFSLEAESLGSSEVGWA